MKEKSNSKYVNTVYLSDLFYAVLDKLPIILLIGLLAFLAIFIPAYRESKAVLSEPPAYTQVMDVEVFSDFENSSLLSTAEAVLDDETLDAIINGYNIKVTPGELRSALVCTMEGKSMVRYSLYAKDAQTISGVMEGLLNIAVPKLGERTEASHWVHSFSEGGVRPVKVNEYKSNGNPGVISGVDPRKVKEWDAYVREKTSKTSMVKKPLLAGIMGLFFSMLAVMATKLLGRKMDSISQVEAASGLPVIAVTDKSGQGMENLQARLMDAEGKEGKLSLIPVRPIGSPFNLEDKWKVESPISQSAEAVSKCKEEGTKGVLLVEDGAVRDYELINSMELLKNAGIEVVGTVITGIKENKLKRQKEYFGKYYR